jgi:hypothetical protein
MFGRIFSRAVNVASKGPRVGLTMPRRTMGGGHGHGHGHKKATTPYDAPASPGYSETPYFLDMAPGQQSEGYEIITIFTYLACTGILVFNIGAKDNETFRTWCRREALAREEHIAKGGEVEFGKYYQTVVYEEPEIGALPVVVGK